MKPYFYKLIRAFSILLGIVVLPGVLFYLGMNDSPAKTRLSARDLRFTDVRLSSPNGFSYDLVGKLENTSQRYEVDHVVLRVTFKDCTPAGECETVGKDDVWIYASVPPTGTREFKVPLITPEVKYMRDRMQWTYAVTEIEAH